MIIFDEKKHAENIIENGYKNIKYIARDNIILVKYWKSLGCNENEIKNNLRDIMIQFQDLYNDSILDLKINRAIKVGMKYDLLTNVKVKISKSELESIGKLNNIQLKKMLFIFLFIWKFRGKPQRLKISNRDVIQLCKVSMNNKVFWENLYQITQSKMLSMVEYKSKSYYKINIPECDDTIIEIDVEDNIIEYYMQTIDPDKYINCEQCSKLVKLTSNRKKYCEVCWKEINREQIRKRVEKHRM